MVKEKAGSLELMPDEAVEKLLNSETFVNKLIVIFQTSELRTSYSIAKINRKHVVKRAHKKSSDKILILRLRTVMPFMKF